MRTTLLRCLAGSAVTALALSGLAVAGPAAHAAEGDPVLLSQLDGAAASTRFDGWDRTIRLAAEIPDPAATVQFSYNPDPDATSSSTGWVALPGTPVVQDRFATLDWDGGTVVGSTVALRVVTTAPGAGPTQDVRNDVAVRGPASSGQTVTLRGIDDAGGQSSPPPGFFRQRYADEGKTATLLQVSGATSATSGTVAVSWRQGDDESFNPAVTAPVETRPVVNPETGDWMDAGAFTAALDLTGSGVAQDDVLAFRAVRDADEVWVSPVYEQQVAAIWGEVQEPRRPTRADVLLRVVDQEGVPVRGVQVWSGGDGEVDAERVGYTDAAGQLVVEQQVGTRSYYANVTDSDPFEDHEGDVRSEPVSVQYVAPIPAAVAPAFADGDAFDLDEYASGDIAIQVLDQGGDPVAAGEQASYRLYREGTPAPATLTTGTTNPAGRVVVGFTPSGAGTYRLDYALGEESDPEAASVEHASFTTGQAVLTLQPAGTATAAIGGTIQYTATLAIGTEELAGRRISLSYTRGTEVVPGKLADAGIVTSAGGLGTSRTLVTDDGGAVAFAVRDESETPKASEINGRLKAATAAVVAGAGSTLDGNPGASASGTTRFGPGTPGTASIQLNGANNGARTDVLSVVGPDAIAGEKVTLFRYGPNGPVAERTLRLNARGDLPRIEVRDRNRAARTKYVARLLPSIRVKGDTSGLRSVT